MSAWDNYWILLKYHITLFLKIIELIWSQVLTTAGQVTSNYVYRS